MARRLVVFAVLSAISALSIPVHAQTSVCVEVQIRSWTDESDSTSTDGSADLAAEDDDTGENSATTASAETTPTAGGESAPAAGQDASQNAAPPDVAANTPDLGSGAPAGFDDDEFGTDGGRQRLFTPVIAHAPVERPLARLRPTLSEQRAATLDPAAYLRRLLEYRVTHRDGFEAERRGCAERLRVQLYPLEAGYTVFARYSGTSREEKVDEAQLDEFRALAERLESALLGDEPIESTLTRRTVLRADSEGEMRRIQGQRQFLFGIGTLLLVGRLPTARGDGSAPAVNDYRLLAPLAINMGTRRAFRAWALDAYGGVVIGTSRKAASRAIGGGHADYTFGMGMTLHFLRYLHPDAVNSFYGGGGASFQLHRYRILPRDRGSDGGVFGGGMNVDLVMGYEVMRASALHFFVEMQAVMPAYQFDSENSNGGIQSYIPGALVQIGLLR